MMAFSGVRSSWLMLAMNSDLALEASSASTLAAVSAVDLLLAGDGLAEMLGILTDQRAVLEPAISKCTHKTPAPMRIASRHSLN